MLSTKYIITCRKKIRAQVCENAYNNTHLQLNTVDKKNPLSEMEYYSQVPKMFIENFHNSLSFERTGPLQFTLIVISFKLQWLSQLNEEKAQLSAQQSIQKVCKPSNCCLNCSSQKLQLCSSDLFPHTISYSNIIVFNIIHHPAL